MQLRPTEPDPIRVLLGPMPDLLREMLEDLLSREKDMLVLGRPPSAHALASACSERADMLILQAGADSECGLLDAIVDAPPFSVFAISASGNDATAVSFVHETVDFDSSSLAALAAAIRQIARGDPATASEGKQRWQG